MLKAYCDNKDPHPSHTWKPRSGSPLVWFMGSLLCLGVQTDLPLHRTEAGTVLCSTCDGSGCPDCTDPA